MADLSDLIEEWRNENRAYHWEGDSGMKKFESLCEALGYDRTGFRFGDPIEHFLSDNPGAIDAIVEWMCERNTPEWVEALESQLPEREEDEEEAMRQRHGINSGCDTAP